jgi:hypothetical protein
VHGCSTSAKQVAASGPVMYLRWYSTEPVNTRCVMGLRFSSTGAALHLQSIERQRFAQA